MIRTLRRVRCDAGVDEIAEPAIDRQPRIGVVVAAGAVALPLGGARCR